MPPVLPLLPVPLRVAVFFSSSLPVLYLSLNCPVSFIPYPKLVIKLIRFFATESANLLIILLSLSAQTGL